MSREGTALGYLSSQHHHKDKYLLGPFITAAVVCMWFRLFSRLANRTVVDT